jgi:hypothetical protein
MPQEKELQKLIPQIYKKNTENLLLFGWVNAQKQIVPTVTIEQAIWNYFRFFGIDDWDMESARTTYSRMQKEYYMDCRETT